MKRFPHEYRMKFYITRCENADFRTRSVRKTAFYIRSDENKFFACMRACARVCVCAIEYASMSCNACMRICMTCVVHPHLKVEARLKLKRKMKHTHMPATHSRTPHTNACTLHTYAMHACHARTPRKRATYERHAPNAHVHAYVSYVMQSKRGLRAWCSWYTSMCGVLHARFACAPCVSAIRSWLPCLGRISAYVWGMRE